MIPQHMAKKFDFQADCKILEFGLPIYLLVMESRY